MKHCAAVLAAAALVPSPALAQTDDLILNDTIRMLANHAGYEAMAERCAAVTGSDPSIAAAFAGYVERSSAWVIAGVTLIGSRGGPDDPAAALAAAREREIDSLAARFANDPDPAGTCREFAADIAGSEIDIADFYPLEAQRMQEAQRGERPAIDLATVPAVTAAMNLWQQYEVQKALFIKCRSLTGDTAWEDVLAGYIDRNFTAYIDGQGVLTRWGATAPWRYRTVTDTAEAEAQRAIHEAPDGADRCRDMLAVVADGALDLATVMPGAVAAIAAAGRP